MTDVPTAGDGPPVPTRRRLLDDHAKRADTRAAGALVATALRTGSRPARSLLAHIATDGSSSLDDILAAARGHDRSRLLSVVTRPSGLSDLAYVMALQGLEPEDGPLALALYDLRLDLFGADERREHQEVHAQLALLAGKRQQADQLCSTYDRMSARIRTCIRLDTLNPFTNGDGNASEWLSSFQALLPEPKTVLRDDPERPPLDRLTTLPVEQVDSDLQITVIVPCFRPGPELLTAVRSILNQSWTNTEIIVVDDGSPSEHAAVLAACADLDPRIKIIELPVNGGTYAARNTGLDAATGEFVTFQDSDDWSHPVRLQVQAESMIEDPSLVATATDGLRINENLVICQQPGRVVRTLYLSSLMFRRERVMRRVGYLDELRKSADTEYYLRIQAAYGEGSVRRIGGPAYVLIRAISTSLSAGEFRPGWRHPSRHAYQSAYGLWHQKIRDGKARAYLPRAPDVRPFAAPLHLRVDRSSHTAHYDVLFCGEWRDFGGPQKSMMEEMGALIRAGYRVGMMHLEAYRFMKKPDRMLSDPVQELINSGAVDFVALSDHVHTSVLVIRYPPVLQFLDQTPSTVRAKKIIILANQAASEMDGSDVRYVPDDCTQAVRAVFGTEPVWVPQGPQVRATLTPVLRPEELANFDMSGIVDTEKTIVSRTGFRSTLPVIGRHSRDNWTKWPGDPETLFGAYPAAADFDVRIMGGGKAVAALAGSVPEHWLVYEYNEVDVWSFLFQLDFWVYYPHDVMIEAFGRAILEAMASGCVVILPERFRSTFGDGAIYREPHEVQATIREYYADKDLYLSQSRLAQQRVIERHSWRSYAQVMTMIIAADSWHDVPGYALEPAVTTR